MYIFLTKVYVYPFIILLYTDISYLKKYNIIIFFSSSLLYNCCNDNNKKQKNLKLTNNNQITNTYIFFVLSYSTLQVNLLHNPIQGPLLMHNLQYNIIFFI